MNALTDRLSNLQLSIRWRITLPFLLLALLLGLGATYFVLRLIQETGEERLLRQLANSGQQAADAVVGVEQDMLALQRLVANTEGVLAATLAEDAEALRSSILPLVVNAEADVVVVLDDAGSSLLAIRRLPAEGAGNYETVRGESYYADWPFVGAVLEPEQDNLDKSVGLGQVQVSGQMRTVFFVSGPIQTASGRSLGAVLAGEYLEDMAEQIGSASGSNVIFYAQEGGAALATSFDQQQAILNSLPAGWLQESLSEEAGTPVRSIEVAGVSYREALIPLTARQGEAVLGVMGVSLLDSVQPEGEAVSRRQSQQTARLVGLIGGVGLLLIGVIGLLISYSITRPLVEIAQATQQVASGNLDVEVPERGGGEVTVVARSFNQMVRGLRQSTQGMDWGRSELPAAELHEWEREETIPLPQPQTFQASILALAVRPRAGATFDISPALAAEQAWQRVEVLERVVSAHRGRLIQFDGNEALAAFGLPPERQPLSVSVLVGSHAAVALVEELRSLDLTSRPGAGAGFAVSTVLHAGEVAVGDMGQRYGLANGVYGVTVSVAQELLDAAAQRPEGGVLVTDAVYQSLAKARSQFVFGRKGVVSLRPPGGEIVVREVQERQVQLIETGQS